MTSREWIDISVPVRDGMVCWPGDPPPRIEQKLAMPRGDSMNLSFATMGLHTGTHMDAPLHFVDGAASIDRMPFAATVGRARVIEIRDQVSVKAAEIEPYGLKRGERVLFKTRNSQRDWPSREFFQDYVGVSLDGARMLAACGVQTIGIDYLSVGVFGAEGEETHRVLLGAGIWIIEGLDLSKIQPGEYELICLPLRVIGAEGAPARAILARV